MIKALGALCILVSGIYVSLSVARVERRRLQVLDAYIALIYFIKGQIDCYALPLGDIMARADPALILACLGHSPARAGAGEGYRSVIPTLLSTGEPVRALVRASAAYLDPECERLLSAFAGELGHTYRADQVARCDHYLTSLGQKRDRMADTLPARVRVGSTLSICCAAAAAILLW